jgi:hypothetical protein
VPQTGVLSLHPRHIGFADNLVTLFNKLWKLMSCLSNPAHDGVVDFANSFDPWQPHAIEIHLDAQLLDFIAVAPRVIRFEEVTTALLAFIAMSAATMPVFSSLSGVTLRTFQFSIMLNQALPLQQRPNFN